jgi:hypothetical protein
MGKLVFYRISEQPFEIDVVRKALSGVPGISFRGVELPGALLWADVEGSDPPVAIRLNETCDAIWIDSDDVAGFEVASSFLRNLDENAVLADLQGNWATVAPGMDAIHIRLLLTDQ